MLLLKLSIVIATYNSAKTLQNCLNSIQNQDYPKDRIEIVVADGGSTDSTLSLVKHIGAKVINIANKKLQGPEYNRAKGAHAANGEILVFIDHDNVLPHNRWLRRMVQPLMDDSKVIGVETIRYHYSPDEPLLGRYFSLFGVNDIVPFYLGKADRLSYLFDNPKEYGVYKKATIREFEDYFIIDFNPNEIPTLGSNGFMIRKNILMKYAKTNPEYFYHIDVNVDLIRRGFNRYALIKDSIIHKTNERGLIDYFKRRKLFMEKYHLESLPNRRYSVYEKNDKLNLIRFVINSTFFITPTLDAIFGYIKIHDFAWFINPIICFGTLIIYSTVYLNYKIKKLNKYLR